MLSATVHNCPRCGGAVGLEHYARAVVPTPGHDRVEEFVYCEFCERGWETTTYADGERFVLDFVNATEPLNFAKFLRRLAAAKRSLTMKVGNAA